MRRADRRRDLCGAGGVGGGRVADLRARLADLLGAFAPYAQKVEGVTAIDQGIQIQVVSALADETEGWVYLAVTDLTGDRLDASTDLDGLNYVDGGLQSYDPETKLRCSSSESIWAAEMRRENSRSKSTELHRMSCVFARRSNGWME